MIRALTLAIGIGAIAGCAAVRTPLEERLQSSSQPVRECAEWFRALDEAVDAAAVRDAEYHRLPGFPYLRVDRFLASLRPRAQASDAAFQALVDRMRGLDLESRRFEIENLPQERYSRLAMTDAFAGAAPLQRTQDCGALLERADLARPMERTKLLEEASVPDDYSDASRAIGLYPLVRLVFARGVRNWQEETLASFRAAPAAPAGATLVRYAPPLRDPASRAQVAALLDQARFDPLGIPVLSARDLERVAQTYAPSFEVAVATDDDRFGALYWTRQGDVPAVDPADAVVYVRPAYTRYGDAVLLQLVYTIWFPERPAASGADLLAGKLDGIVWRVTLAPDGEPVLYDSIHPCGCYHMFFPTPRAAAKAAPDPSEEWAFAPQKLQRIREGERPLLYIASGTHYIEHVSVVAGADSVARYRVRPYGELRSLQFGSRRRSIFGPDGIVAGTERAERLLFWPMGIASAGAMRQWGRQATAFVGRRHFDDADLVERRFELDLGGAG